ncbi:MAG: D-alanine--D-alanine ligase [Microbacteriaceae bacterium]|nr:D-alanine--D-alanine ligase [Microbacteriaceae bacterium]
MSEKNLQKIAVIGGGVSSEHDISYKSGKGIAANLDPELFESVFLYITREGIWADDTGKELAPTPSLSLAKALEIIAECAAVIPAVHGRHGEDGALAALFELAQIPAVSSPLRAGSLAMDKWVTKLMAAEMGIGGADDLLLSEKLSPETIDIFVEEFEWEGPVVVKPVAEGSSFGVVFVESKADLAEAISSAFQFDDRVIIEEFVGGREVDISVFRDSDGNLRISAPLEIHRDKIFGFDDKYHGEPNFTVPAILTDEQHQRIREIAESMYTILGCIGVARVDCFIREDGEVILNEVNTMPGMTEFSQVPRMYAIEGLSYTDLLTELIAATLEKH